MARCRAERRRAAATTGGEQQRGHEGEADGGQDRRADQAEVERRVLPERPEQGAQRREERREAERPGGALAEESAPFDPTEACSSARDRGGYRLLLAHGRVAHLVVLSRRTDPRLRLALRNACTSGCARGRRGERRDGSRGNVEVPAARALAPRGPSDAGAWAAGR